LLKHSIYPFPIPGWLVFNDDISRVSYNACTHFGSTNFMRGATQTDRTVKIDRKRKKKRE